MLLYAPVGMLPITDPVAVVEDPEGMILAHTGSFSLLEQLSMQPQSFMGGSGFS